MTFKLGAALAAWLDDPDNARLYEPPAPIALGPRNMTGAWRYTTTCGSRSRLGRMKLTGVFQVRHAGGNRYSGIVKNSQGQTGRFSGHLNGRRFSGEINWGLFLGRTQFSATVSDQKLALSGRDSNGCRTYATK